MISVGATVVKMAKSPQTPIEEGSAVEYVCQTDSAYPDPPVLLWYVDGVHVDINDEHATENSTISLGDYHGLKTKSGLRLIAKRAMNKKIVKCVLENDDTKLKEHTLSVKCKYFNSAYIPM